MPFGYGTLKRNPYGETKSVCLSQLDISRTTHAINLKFGIVIDYMCKTISRIKRNKKMIIFFAKWVIKILNLTTRACEVSYERALFTHSQTFFSFFMDRIVFDFWWKM